jgi:cytochrome b561
MTQRPQRFTAFSRLLHWLMAVLVLAMLAIGVGMVSSVSERYHLLLSIHRPLGIAILALVVIRLVNRLLNPAPALPTHLPLWPRAAAKLSHIVLYALMLALPLVGWAMLSAGGYPIVLYAPLQLPPLLSRDPMLYALLRQAHTYLAYLLFATFLAHLGAALLHALIHRDGVFASMAPWRARPVGAPHVGAPDNVMSGGPAPATAGIDDRSFRA